MFFPSKKPKMSCQDYLNTLKKMQISGLDNDCVLDYKYLGLTIVMQLKFAKYTNVLANNVAYKISILSRNRAAISKDTALTLYKSMILTLFVYGSHFYRSANVSILIIFKLFKIKLS